MEAMQTLPQKLCTSCGGQIVASHKYCTHCGVSLNSKVNPPPVRSASHSRDVSSNNYQAMGKLTPVATFLENLFLLPFRLLWDAIVIVGAIWLEVIWIGFLFGSVVGVVLVLIFAPPLFIAPLGLFAFVVNPWPEKTGGASG